MSQENSFEGHLLKMKTELQSPVQYQLDSTEGHCLALNQFIGKKVKLLFLDEIKCIACGNKIKKSFAQGHCYPCMSRLASCDMCIMKPETCHHAQGTCRDEEWAEKNCMVGHTVYLANSSGVKVGITRNTQVPTRWIDQGAVAALPIAQVPTRLDSGLVEMHFKDFVADKTNWRKMLKNEVEEIDLYEVRDQLFESWPDHLNAEPLEMAEMIEINYPVNEYPDKIKSFNLDKEPLVEGILQGIKGQYLLLNNGVINLRKYQGYHITFKASE